MGKLIDDIGFADLLPSSISGDDTIRSAAGAMDGELKQTTDQARALSLISRIDELDDPVLSALAWQFHVDYWPGDFTLSQKRAAVKNSLLRHMRKGTPAAVEEAIAEVIGSGTVTEWYEYGGNPGYFRIETTETLGNWEIFGKRLMPNIEANKNTRSWLDRITVRRPLSGTIDIGILVAKCTRRLVIKPRMAMDFSIRPWVALVPMTCTKTRISVRQ